MNKIITKTTSFLFAKQTSMFSTALILSVMIVLARIFGFMRYRILSGLFTKEELDIFLASFKLPDLVFEILITGALTSSFIPLFIKYQKDRKERNENISSIINVILLLMTLLILVLYVSLETVIPLITPGFSREKIETIIFFTRLLLLGQLPFMIVGNLLTGIAQANKTFILPSLAPVFYNLAIIAGALFLTPSFHLLAPILGVIVGSLFFLFIQLPVLFDANFSFSLIVRKTAGLIEFFRMMIPRALTVIVAQIDATIDLILATLLGAGSYTIFYFAQHLQLFPVSVIGVAFGQASLPYLSEIFQQGRQTDFKKIIVDSVLNLFFFTIPIMSFFIFARTPLVRLFFGGEKFDWDATVQTAIAFSYFSVSLPLHSIYYFLTRSFYATLDTRTPFFISLFSIGLNTVLSILFVILYKLPVWSLAISFSTAMILNVVLLFLFLAKKTGGLDFKTIIFETVKMGVSAFIASVAAYFLMKLLDGLVFDTAYTINVFFLLVTGALTHFSLYLLITWFVDVREIYLIGKLLLKAKEYRQRIVEMYTTYE